MGSVQPLSGPCYVIRLLVCLRGGLLPCRWPRLLFSRPQAKNSILQNAHPASQPLLTFPSTRLPLHDPAQTDLCRCSVPCPVPSLHSCLSAANSYLQRTTPCLVTAPPCVTGRPPPLRCVVPSPFRLSRLVTLLFRPLAAAYRRCILASTFSRLQNVSGLNTDLVFLEQTGDAKLPIRRQPLNFRPPRTSHTSNPYTPSRWFGRRSSTTCWAYVQSWETV